MHLPDSKALGNGLRKWRKYHNLTIQDVVQQSKRKAEGSKKRSFEGPQASKWELGKQAPPYDRLANDIFPAYGITDLYKLIVFFSSFCQSAPDAGSITLIRDGDLNQDDRLGVLIRYAREDHVKPHPVRIDTIHLKQGAGSTRASHHGFNYLLVTSGSLRCTFWPVGTLFTNEKTKPVLERVLRKGDAIAFPTVLPHRIQSVGKKAAATAVIARSPWGKPEPV